MRHSVTAARPRRQGRIAKRRVGDPRRAA